MQVEVIQTDGYGLEAQVRVGTLILTVMDDFSALPQEVIDYGEPVFSNLTVEGYSWEVMFSGNPGREKKLVNLQGWAYEGFGQIVSIKPVVVDFGPFCLELGDFTNDERCVGEWIVERIGRIDLTFRR
jgi:hypothetical protein